MVRLCWSVYDVYVMLLTIMTSQSCEKMSCTGNVLMIWYTFLVIQYQLQTWLLTLRIIVHKVVWFWRQGVIAICIHQVKSFWNPSPYLPWGMGEIDTTDFQRAITSKIFNKTPPQTTLKNKYFDVIDDGLWFSDKNLVFKFFFAIIF